MGTAILCGLSALWLTDWLERGKFDYTASIGDPNTPSSLHFLGGANQYEAAIFKLAQFWSLMIKTGCSPLSVLGVSQSIWE
jgi:hypothetical protein